MAAGWNFNEASGNVIDYVGTSTFALSGNTVRTADGGGKTGIVGDRGLTQTAEASQTVPLPGQAAQRTIACWAKQTAAITAGWTLEYKNNDLNTGVFGFLWLSGTLRFRAKNPANTPTEISVSPLVDSTWHHLCGSYDGTNLRFFIDGVLDTRTLAFAGPIWVPTNASFLMFDTTGSPLTIDNAQVLDSAITTEPAAAALMNSVPGLAARTGQFFPFFP